MRCVIIAGSPDTNSDFLSEVIIAYFYEKSRTVLNRSPFSQMTGAVLSSISHGLHLLHGTYPIAIALS